MAREKSTRELQVPAVSFTGRITMLFGLVAVMTAIIAAIVLAVVWEDHFRQYALENMERIASLQASALEQNYRENEGWTESTINVERLSHDETIGIQAVDLEGNLVYGDSLLGARAGGYGKRALTPENMVTSPIMVDGEMVGSVNVWTHGTEALLTQRDRTFKETSYGAVVFAAVVAVLISCFIGYFVSRSLANPIRRITRTANEIKHGNLSARTNLIGTDEIAQLGMTIDDMAQSIENDRELELRLTNDVAHELRTPLMAMQATIEAMVDGILPPDEQRLLMLNGEVMRLGKLVDALLKLSRLENRSTPVRAEELDLGELIGELVLSHQMLIEESGLAFEYSYEPDVFVMADPDLIKQATANIVSNAVRYTPAGGKISVSVRRGNRTAQIAVADTGIGLSDDDLQHIFSRFWRADAGRDRASGGLGVGLAIVKEIVDRHDGWVNVESELGVGSTFTINIPLVREDDRKGAKKKQDKQGGTRNLAQTIMRFPAKGEQKEQKGAGKGAREADAKEPRKADAGKREKARREKARAAEQKKDTRRWWSTRRDSQQKDLDDELSDALIDVKEGTRGEETSNEPDSDQA